MAQKSTDKRSGLELSNIPPAAYGYLPLDALVYDRGDRSVWARAIALKAKGSLRASDLEDAITTLKLTDTMKGSSTMEIGIQDGNWDLVDSGFLDANRNGTLELIDCNYPKGSRVWWRLTQARLNGVPGSGGCTITLSFMERPAAHLMSHHGPLKATRAKKTRAEFIEGLVETVEIYPIVFACNEIHARQKIKKEERPKQPGIPKSADLTINGRTLDDEQRRQIKTTLGVCNDLRAPELAVQAIICAGIGESEFHANRTSSAGAKGVFQLMPSWWGQISWRDTEAQAEYWLKNGYWGKGGGIALAKAGHNAGEIATLVEGSGEPGSYYGKFLDEAKKIIDAGGGVSGPGDSYTPQYNFEVGTRADPHEDYWTAINRLAQEVRWALFIDGRTLFYDSELTLIRQEPAAILERGDPSIISFRCDWDARHIATNAEIQVVDDPFTFRAGEVLWLKGFGPASTGSTAELPGRWLIEEIERDIFSPIDVLRLKQPERPLPEPRNSRTQRAGTRQDPANLGDITGKTPKEIIDEFVVPLAKADHMSTGITPQMVEQANATHGATVSGGRSDHQGPPSIAWAADMSNGSAPTKEMDKLADDLADLFGFAKHSQSSERYVFGRDDKTVQGYRIQLGYRTTVGGDHYNHVHLGIRDAGGYSRGTNRTTGPPPTGPHAPYNR